MTTPIALTHDCLPPQEPHPDDVVRAVAEAWGYTPDDIRGPLRRQRLTSARRATIKTLRRLCPSLNVEDIARAVNRDHSTVIHHLKGRHEPLA